MAAWSTDAPLPSGDNDMHLLFLMYAAAILIYAVCL
jgi:hypothetical protein